MRREEDRSTMTNAHQNANCYTVLNLHETASSITIFSNSSCDSPAKRAGDGYRPHNRDLEETALIRLFRMREFTHRDAEKKYEFVYWTNS